MEGLSEKSDEQFYWYHLGTLSFFERDKERLKIYLDKLENNYSEYYANNFMVLKSLYEKFDKDYRDACRWKS